MKLSVRKKCYIGKKNPFFEILGMPVSKGIRFENHIHSKISFACAFELITLVKINHHHQIRDA